MNAKTVTRKLEEMQKRWDPRGVPFTYFFFSKILILAVISSRSILFSCRWSMIFDYKLDLGDVASQLPF